MVRRDRFFPEKQPVLLGKARHQVLGALQHEIPAQMGKADQRRLGGQGKRHGFHIVHCGVLAFLMVSSSSESVRMLACQPQRASAAGRGS